MTFVICPTRGENTNVESGGEEEGNDQRATP
jgi:hypothetical protein